MHALGYISDSECLHIIFNQFYAMSPGN